MFLDRKNQYCENDYTTQSNLQIEYNPYQITSGFFTELKQKITICMKTQKIKQSWERRTELDNQASWLQTILQSYSNQLSMVLTQKRNIDQ